MCNGRVFLDTVKHFIQGGMKMALGQQIRQFGNGSIDTLNGYKNSLMAKGNHSLSLVKDNIPAGVSSRANNALATISNGSTNAWAWAKRHPIQAAVYGIIGLGIIGATGFFARRKSARNSNELDSSRLPN